jgi:hypothetical protein
MRISCWVHGLFMCLFLFITDTHESIDTPTTLPDTSITSSDTRTISADTSSTSQCTPTTGQMYNITMFQGTVHFYFKKNIN